MADQQLPTTGQNPIIPQTVQRPSPPSRHGKQRSSPLNGSQARGVLNPAFNRASSSARSNARLYTYLNKPMYRDQAVQNTADLIQDDSYTPSSQAFHERKRDSVCSKQGMDGKQELANSTYYSSQSTLQTMMRPVGCENISFPEAHQQVGRLAPAISYNQVSNSQLHEPQEEQDSSTLASETEGSPHTSGATQNLPLPATTTAVAVQGKKRWKETELKLPDTIADPTLSPVNLHSTNLRDARHAIANRDLEFEPLANDSTLPTTDAKKSHYAKQLFLAMNHYDSILDKKADTKRRKSGHYNELEMEKVCYEIVDTAVKLHTSGPGALGIYDDDTLKSIKKESHFTFKDRMDYLAKMFTFIKNRCDAVMKGTMLEELVAQPRLKLTQSLANLYQNENKAEDQKVGRTIKAAKAAASLGKTRVTGQQVSSQPKQQLPAPATRPKGGRKKAKTLPFVVSSSTMPDLSPDVSFESTASSKNLLATEAHGVNVAQTMQAEFVSNTTQEQHTACFSNFEEILMLPETSARNVQQTAFMANLVADTSSPYVSTGNSQNVSPGTNYNTGVIGPQLPSNDFGCGPSNNAPWLVDPLIDSLTAEQMEEINLEFPADFTATDLDFAPDSLFDNNNPAPNGQFSTQANFAALWDPIPASTAPTYNTATASFLPLSPPVQNSHFGFDANTIYTTLPAPISAAPKRKRRSSNDTEDNEHVDMPTPASKRRYLGPL